MVTKIAAQTTIKHPVMTQDKIMSPPFSNAFAIASVAVIKAVFGNTNDHHVM
ncbi:hypothetical protein VDGD_21044 [Verticillium dahliae]|uniref:Uncharacterized protein n=1 Tax=Verticillium dahliae TaxID=27337 RepID=A0AA45AS10_VERDA|nr:hypothetical protein BJF96_g289 [Verticillium dahliae]RBQ82539.1 hypothetical protein VDGD_21044 [Verticillium dahliae]